MPSPIAIRREDHVKTAKVFVIAGVWAVSLVGVSVWAQGRQAVPPTPLPPQPAQVVPMNQNGMPTITGNDIGFQAISGPDRDGRVLGRWMVKIDGKWHEVKGTSVGIVR
jgi:hypothetical protein